MPLGGGTIKSVDGLSAGASSKRVPVVRPR